MSRATVGSLMTAHDIVMPLVDLVAGRSIADDVHLALAALRNNP